MRQTYLFSVISALPNVYDSKSLRSLLWLVGEFCLDSGNILAAIQSINSGLGELPMLATEEKYETALKNNENIDDPQQSKSKVSTKVLADGTYVSEINEEANINESGRQLPNIKSNFCYNNNYYFHYYLELFLDGKFECSGVLADSLCKLMIRLRQCKIDQNQFIALRTRVLLMLTSILRLGGSKYVDQPIDRDSAERIALSIQILINETQSDDNYQVVDDLEKALTVESEIAFNSIQNKNRNGKNSSSTSYSDNVKIDDPITFKLFKDQNSKKNSTFNVSISSDEALNLLLNDNIGNVQGNDNNVNTLNIPSGLNRVVQLTGFSDAIYAETYVKMSGKEVLLDLLLVNQTEETLQNVSIDLVCAGDLKLIEKPAQLTLPAYSFSSCKAIFKVTATNHGQIFGCISYLTGSNGQETETVILSEIKIDVLEYVKAAFIDETIFRESWVLLEWENKISIKVQRGGELKNFLEYLLKKGNLTCITPNVFMKDDDNESDHSLPSFLACNLYAKSIFGKNRRKRCVFIFIFLDEEILANLCLEMNPKTKLITGHLRLRSKTQGLAVAYGDKLNTLIQKLK